MAGPQERLAASLEVLRKAQDGGQRVFQTSEFTRVHRERLIKAGYLMEIMRGWVVSSSPTVQAGDTTPFFAAFWEFCAAYGNHRFGDDWVLSPEASLAIHAECTSVPAQVVLGSPDGKNNLIELPFGTSFYDLKQMMPPANDLTEKNGLRVFTPEAALLRVSEDHYRRNPTEVQAVLASIRSVSPVLSRLLDGGHSKIAGRLAGALRRIGRDRDADQILNAMSAAGYDVRESDPFDQDLNVAQLSRVTSPLMARLRAFWQRHRGKVLDAMPAAPGQPRDRGAYLAAVQEKYTQDAYHSLSIEGYVVSPELIGRVMKGQWDPQGQDKEDRNALAARGYHEAFEQVRKNVASVINGVDAAEVWNSSYMDWYSRLFAPSVQAGILKPSDLAGFRANPVYIKNSQHVPPRVEAVPDGMDALAELLVEEEEASVRAVLGHWLFGYVHPFPDGNGRIARFTMNLLLAGGGYPWTVIKVDDRSTYMAALESASVHENIRPFADFMAALVKREMDPPAAS